MKPVAPAKPVAREGPAKGKSCCMVFKAKMYQILSKCTKDGQTNTKYCQTVVNIENKMPNM